MEKMVMNTSTGFNKNNILSKFFAVILGLTVFLGLSGCSGGGSGTDDRPSLSIDAPSVTEGTTGTTASVVFTVTLSENAETALTLNYATADDVATAADNDFTPVSGTVTIAAGTRSATISDVFVNGDDVFEVNETFNLVVNNPQGLDIKTPLIIGKATINNDDNADPEGYFSGTATLGGNNLTDLTGMMFNSRLMLFSPSQNVLFDITGFSATVFDYTAVVNVYEAGVLTQSNTNVSLTGTTDEASISGTFANGTGLAVGSFNIVYDINNNIGATLPRIETVLLDRWAGNVFGVNSSSFGGFSSDSVGKYSVFDNDCTNSFNVLLSIPDTQINIYEMAHDVLDSGGATCQYLSTGHTGFVSVLSINSVDTLVFAYSNGANGGTTSLFGVLTK
ncbi:MAG TPA: hypothetical protein ENJ08_13360 [Gammaproteobacteria bacterium]|nr:hypothetical protein [Gammaproteobacteria bacterium]